MNLHSKLVEIMGNSVKFNWMALFEKRLIAIDSSIHVPYMHSLLVLSHYSSGFCQLLYSPGRSFHLFALRYLYTATGEVSNQGILALLEELGVSDDVYVPKPLLQKAKAYPTRATAFLCKDALIFCLLFSHT